MSASDISDEPRAPKLVLDTVVLFKPPPFGGKERNFSDWRFVFESCASLLDTILSVFLGKPASSEQPLPIAST